MKNKLIYSGIIAVVFLTALFIYKDEITLIEMISTFIGASGIIVGVWNWLSKEDVKEDFEKVTNADYSTWKKIDSSKR